MLETVETLLKPEGLFVMGTCHPRDHDASDTVETLVLIGAGPGMWDRFSAAPESFDDQPDPLDRWSKRIIGGVAASLGAACAFPSDGPPYPPFIGWALKTGRFHLSPVGMMVHDTAGLMISLRGALLFDQRLDLPDTASPSSCDACADKPCQNACPVSALGGADGYDVATCKAYLKTPPGGDCMERGCRARRACPVSDAFARPPSQSAFHMQAFLKNDP